MTYLVYDITLFFYSSFSIGKYSGFGASAQAPKQAVAAAQVADIVDQTKEIEQLRQERDQARLDKAIAEAKNEVIGAGNSRLQTWIALYGILIIFVVGAFGFATYKIAAVEAAKAASKELEDAHQEINDIREKINKLQEDAGEKLKVIDGIHEEAQGYSKELKSYINNQQEKVAEKLSPDLQKEFDEAAKEVDAKPPAQRTPMGLKILLSKAWQAKNYDKMPELAEELIEKADGDDDRVLAYYYWVVHYMNWVSMKKRLQNMKRRWLLNPMLIKASLIGVLC